MIVLLFPGPIVPGLVRCPSKVKDFGKVVCGHGWRARAPQRTELPVSLCGIKCALWAVLGSGNGPYKLYIEIIEAAAIHRKVCDGRDGGLICWGTGCAEGTQRTQGVRRQAYSTSGFPVRSETCFSLWSKLAGLRQSTNIPRGAYLGQEKKDEKGPINELYDFSPSEYENVGVGGVKVRESDIPAHPLGETEARRQGCLPEATLLIVGNAGARVLASQL